MITEMALAATGSSGVNTHTGVNADPGAYDAVAFQFVVEAVGASPTVSWKVQGTLADNAIPDANAIWYDIGYITDASDTISAATRSLTAIGGQVNFVSNPVARRYSRFRLVVSANTNVTYRGEMYLIRCE